MKILLIASALLSTSVFAQETWTETFKLPEGMTYRARAAGFDCGEFFKGYVNTPAEFEAQKITYRQLAADKDLNKFLIEATYPGADGSQCIYGSYLDRNRDDKTLDFTHSLIKTESSEENCVEGQAFLDFTMKKVSYEVSKRGIRYIATQVIAGENDVCESGIVRAVFDRKF